MFVRALEPEEAQRLVKITRTARDWVRLRRAGIVLASLQGRSAAEVAAMFAASPQYAREVICRVAKTPPQQLGRPFTTWSLSKLVEHQGEHHRIVICTTPSPSVVLAGSSRFPTSASAVDRAVSLTWRLT